MEGVLVYERCGALAGTWCEKAWSAGCLLRSAVWRFGARGVETGRLDGRLVDDRERQIVRRSGVGSLS
jgi:hypothetical protein